MFMRYEWGLAVGHTYTHSDAVAAMQGILRAVSTCDDAAPGPASTLQQPEGAQEYDEPTGSSASGGNGQDLANGEGGLALGEGGENEDENENENENEQEEEEEEQEEEEDEDGYHSTSTVDTDDSRLRWGSDEELEREIELFGS